MPRIFSKFRYYLYLIVPAFANNETVEKERVQSFRRWRIDKFEKVASTLKVKTNYMDGYCGQEDRQGSICKKYGKGTTKGQFIREKISVILTSLKDASIKIEERTFVILIDGSGRIDYNSVITVLKTLISGEELVLSCRLGKLAVSKRRESVELFENFLVSEKYRVHLPDAQCGCWGFRLTAKDRLPFDSEKYSIEIELLINALKNNINVCFVPVKTILDTRTSSFKAKDNFDKLKFISKSIQFDRFDLEAKYLKFRKEKKRTLPSSYISLFKKIKSEYKNRLRCKNKCGITCLSQVNKIR